jgi:hypothetical protein
MAKKDDMARAEVAQIIIIAFGANYVATVDKKIYVEAQDGPGGETLQFSIAITMPKTGVARNSAPTTSVPADSAWEGPAAPAVAPPTEISDSDKAKVAKLMKQLGLE